MPDTPRPHPVPVPATRTVAVVLAGGSGRGLGPATPKQLLKIAGKSIPERTLAIFETAPRVEKVARTSPDVLLSDVTGHVVDVRREDPPGIGASGAREAEAVR